MQAFLNKISKNVISWIFFRFLSLQQKANILSSADNQKPRYGIKHTLVLFWNQ